MARYEFDGRFAFATQTARTNFGAAVQAYIDSNPSVFTGYTPQNQETNYHGTPMWKVQARFTNRQNLGNLFDALKAQAISRGAIAGSTMWLKTVADGGGVTEGVAADAPGWADYPVT